MFLSRGVSESSNDGLVELWRCVVVESSNGGMVELLSC